MRIEILRQMTDDELNRLALYIDCAKQRAVENKPRDILDQEIINRFEEDMPKIFKVFEERNQPQEDVMFYE